MIPLLDLFEQVLKLWEDICPFFCMLWGKETSSWASRNKSAHWACTVDDITIGLGLGETVKATYLCNMPLLGLFPLCSYYLDHTSLVVSRQSLFFLDRASSCRSPKDQPSLYLNCTCVASSSFKALSCAVFWEINPLVYVDAQYLLLLSAYLGMRQCIYTRLSWEFQWEQLKKYINVFHFARTLYIIDGKRFILATPCLYCGSAKPWEIQEK